MLLGDLASTFHYLFVANGLCTFALLAGTAAVYLSLPRPSPYPSLWGIASACLSLILLGGHMIRPGSLAPESILFYAFSFLAILGGGLLITQRNPARAALAFTLVVLSSCGLFLLLAAPFLMAATIIIYAGAIIVTFLFVLMLAQQEGPSDADQRSREPLLGTIAGFALLGVLLFMLNESFNERRLQPFLEQIRKGAANENPTEIAAALGNEDTEKAFFKNFKEAIQAGGRSEEIRELAGAVDNLQFQWVAARQAKDQKKMEAVLSELELRGTQAMNQFGQLEPKGKWPLSTFSGPSSNQPRESYRRENGVPQMPAENTAYLGRSLFTDYLLAVELGGTLLLVATIGAIAIAYRRPGRAP
jgi:NADH:ubiquinone oxidoreductase subunit 6 (subunit J)